MSIQANSSPDAAARPAATPAPEQKLGKRLGTYLWPQRGIFIGAILAMAVLSVISSLLGQFVVSVLITPLAGASMYLAWKDVFGSAITREAPALPETPQDGGGMVA